MRVLLASLSPSPGLLVRMFCVSDIIQVCFGCKSVGLQALVQVVSTGHLMMN